MWTPRTLLGAVSALLVAALWIALLLATGDRSPFVADAATAGGELRSGRMRTVNVADPPQRTAVRAADVAVAESSVRFGSGRRIWVGRGTLSVRVVDEAGLPVVTAEVSLSASMALRPGSKEPRAGVLRPLGKTGADGRATDVLKLGYHDEHLYSQITVRVRHAHYPDGSFELRAEPGEQVVVLKRGGLLSVSGWIREPSERVFSVTPRTGHWAELPDDVWSIQPMRAPSTHRAPAGQITLWLSHRGDDGREYWSDPVDFAMREGGAQHLHLQLYPAVRVSGELDACVPRPVRGGVVEAWVPLRVGWHSAFVIRRADVSPDGSFRVDGLPRGCGEIIAACAGFRTPPGGDRGQETVAARQAAATRSAIQDPPEWLEKAQNAVFDARAGGARIVVPMDREARVRMRVVDPRGCPLSGARIAFSPNVRRTGVASSFLEREYHALSDAGGFLEIVGLPGGRQSFGVYLRGYRLQSGRIRRPVSSQSCEVTLEVGQTLEHELVLEAVR